MHSRKINWEEVLRLLYTPAELNQAVIDGHNFKLRLPLEVKVAADISAPAPLVMAILIAHDFGIGSDLGLVRLYLDPYPELEGCLR